MCNVHVYVKGKHLTIEFRNALEEMILWTKQGKLWQFPVDNEQGKCSALHCMFLNNSTNSKILISKISLHLIMKSSVHGQFVSLHLLRSDVWPILFVKQI